MTDRPLLRKLLETRSPELAQYAQQLIATVTPFLWLSIASFPEGTKHTPEHTTSVEANAAMLVTPEVASELSDGEIFLLVLACHFHDLGMAAPDWQNQNAEGRSQARREHAIAIGNRLKAEWKELGFREEATANCLAEVCRGHRPQRNDGVANWDDIDLAKILFQQSVRIRVVAALIYAADELDLSAERAPKRTQQWLDIRNEESNRHWRRHQAIQGPVTRDGGIWFEAKVETIGLENDLRRSVFLKAFGAIRDLKSELVRAEIHTPLPCLVVDWNRDELWRFLVIETACDMQARRADDLVATVIERHRQESKTFVPLDDLCLEHPVEECCRRRVQRIIEDMIVQGSVLKGDDSILRLASDTRTGEQFLKLFRDADEIDSLFQGPVSAQHEMKLYSSKFGEAYRESHVTPRVAEVFGVRIEFEHKTSPMNLVLRKSPTASRLIEALRPTPNILVKRQILAMTLLAGVSHDLVQNPDLILDSEFRKSLKCLVHDLTERIPHFIRFIEEWSLTTPLNFEQLTSVLTTSDELIAEANADTDMKPNGHVSITQTTPRSEPRLFLGRILLAGTRAKVHVEILNNSIGPLKVSAEIAGFPNEPIHSFAFGPSGRAVATRFCLRADLEIDPSARLAVLRCHMLGRLDDESPIIVEASPPQTGKGKLNMTFHLPSMKVATVSAIKAFNEIAESGPFELRIEIDGTGRLAQERFESGECPRFPLPLEDSFGQALGSLPSDMFVPWFLSDAQRKMLEVQSNERDSSGHICSELQKNPIEVTTVTLRISNAAGVDFREEFLGFLPPGLNFNAPTIGPGGLFSQDELDKKWDEMSDDFLMTGKFQADYGVLAKLLREWVDDPKKEFPFRFDADINDVHTCKTELAMIHLRKRNRINYFERPVVFRLRPFSELEQRDLELAYWKSVEDTARAELVEEIITEIETKTGEKRSGPIPKL